MIIAHVYAKYYHYRCTRIEFYNISERNNKKILIDFALNKRILISIVYIMRMISFPRIFSHNNIKIVKTKRYSV